MVSYRAMSHCISTSVFGFGPLLVHYSCIYESVTYSVIWSLDSSKIRASIED